MSIYEMLLANAMGEGGGGGGGSSDFSTAQVTVTYNTSYTVYRGEFIYVTDYGMFSTNTVETESTSTTGTYNVVLYKGVAYMFFDNGEPDYEPYTNLTLTGDLEADEYGYITVTGDGTITIS